MDKVNISSQLSKINEYWQPSIIGKLNNHMIKVGKIKGEFLWHKHDNEDEMFLVISGQLTIKYRDRDIIVDPNEFIIIPKGVEHMPVCDEEVHIMLIEPAGTLNTGNIINDRTVYLDEDQ